MRCSDHPNRPSAITCCFLSSLKTLLTLTQVIPASGSMSWIRPLLGRFSGDNHWPHLSDYRGTAMARCLWMTSLSSSTPNSLSPGVASASISVRLIGNQLLERDIQLRSRQSVLALNSNRIELRVVFPGGLFEPIEGPAIWDTPRWVIFTFRERRPSALI